MTPRNKANQLFRQFRKQISGWDHYHDVDDTDSQTRKAKISALYCVKQIMKEIPMYTGNLNPKWEFYNTVRQEIKKIKIAT